MTRSEPGVKSPTAVSVLFGVLLAGTAFYLVPALALDGQALTATMAALVWLGLLGLWLLHRRELRQAAERVLAERRAHRFYRALLEHGVEAHLVLNRGGTITFASENARRVLGLDPEQLTASDRLVDLVRASDRRRALRAFAAVRRQPGSSLSLELGAMHGDGSDCHLHVRVANLSESGSVGGLLVTIRDITPRKAFESEIQHLAYYDALTGLANRRFFLEQGQKALSLASRHNLPAALFYLDLDRFKQVNDILGHEHGDDLLKQVARALQRVLRETDLVTRLGGDEFAVLLTEVRDVESAGRVANRILDAMPVVVSDGRHDVPIGTSLGVAIFPEDADALESLLKAADLAMYGAKTEGGGVAFYRPELRVAVTEQMRLESDLKRGLERHEFQLHYQPVFHLLTGQMVGAEALSRWRHFSRGMVDASEFIGLAERSGLIRSLDRWAIARAVHQRRAQLDGTWIGWVAVNVSPLSLSDPDLPAYVREVLDAAELEPGSLVLELPAGAALTDADAADLMWELKDTGAAIALDDFGAGSTSFARLKRLPVDILKLHPDFAAGIGRGEGDEQMLQGTIAIAHGLRSKVLAKGVERDEQLEWLRDAGCDFIQGYLLGEPVPADRLGPSAPSEAEEAASER